MILRRPAEIGRQWGRGSLWSECIMPNLYRETPITLDAEKRSETGKRSGQTAPTGGRAGSVPVVKRGSGAPGWHRQHELEIGVQLSDT